MYYAFQLHLTQKLHFTQKLFLQQLLYVSLDTYHLDQNLKIFMFL